MSLKQKEYSQKLSINKNLQIKNTSLEQQIEKKEKELEELQKKIIEQKERLNCQEKSIKINDKLDEHIFDEDKVESRNRFMKTFSSIIVGDKKISNSHTKENAKTCKLIDDLQKGMTEHVASNYKITADFITTKTLKTIELAESRQKPMEIYAGLKILSDLYGLNKPTSIENNVQINALSTKQINMLSDDELRALLAITSKVGEEHES